MPWHNTIVSFPNGVSTMPYNVNKDALSFKAFAHYAITFQWALNKPSIPNNYNNKY